MNFIIVQAPGFEINYGQEPVEYCSLGDQVGLAVVAVVAVVVVAVAPVVGPTLVPVGLVVVRLRTFAAVFPAAWTRFQNTLFSL